MATGGRKSHLQVMHEISLLVQPTTVVQGLLGVLPGGGVANFTHVIVKTAFNSTTNTIALGTAPGGAQILAATDLKTIARADAAVAIAQAGPFAADTPIYYTLASTGAAPTLGEAFVWIDFVPFPG